MAHNMSITHMLFFFGSKYSEFFLSVFVNNDFKDLLSTQEENQLMKREMNELKNNCQLQFASITVCI